MLLGYARCSFDIFSALYTAFSQNKTKKNWKTITIRKKKKIFPAILSHSEISPFQSQKKKNERHCCLVQIPPPRVVVVTISQAPASVCGIEKLSKSLISVIFRRCFNVKFSQFIYHPSRRSERAGSWQWWYKSTIPYQRNRLVKTIFRKLVWEACTTTLMLFIWLDTV